MSPFCMARQMPWAQLEKVKHGEGHPSSSRCAVVLVGPATKGGPAKTAQLPAALVRPSFLLVG